MIFQRLLSWQLSAPMCSVLVAWLALAIPTEISAQTQGNAKPTSALQTLRTLVDSMAALRTQLETQTKLAANGENDAVKDAAKKEAAAIQARLAQAERDFEAIATGVDTRDAQPTGDLTKFDVVAELTEMVQPLMREVKAATEQPRLIEQLRAELNAHQRRLGEVQSAVINVEKAIAELPNSKAPSSTDTSVRKALLTTLEKWRYSEKEAKASVEVVNHRLDELLSKRKSVWELASHATQTFFLTRGRNILFALLALLGTMFAWRWAYRWVERFSPWHKKVEGRMPFAARMIDVIYHTLSVVLATAAALTVLYSTGDWLLLGLCLIALVGIVLGARTAVPKYYRQARLLLNFGEVREGERIIHQGLPWLVKSLNMFTELHNPSLRNGRLRVPLDQLTATTSRPLEKDESWFPSKEGDWLLLQDGTLGKTVSQSPEFVHLVLLGGANKAYPTLNFLAQNPQNLSGGFRINAIIRLDHIHRAEVTRTIPELLTERLTAIYAAELQSKNLKSIITEFRASTTVALELEIIADFSGDAASRYEHHRRDLHRHALDICNSQEWKLASQIIPLAPIGG
ncbi:MAG: hypothetical protein JNJ83_15285 [Verrucomicrobiaceae bacterium]|nr:hypothetical protein [Verrucomicrobiaceae bacterium]